MGLIFKILNLIFSFLIFKKFNNLIGINNKYLFNQLLLNKYKNSYLIFLNYPQTNKYNWVVNNSIFIKFLNTNFVNTFPVENFFRKSITFFDTLNDIISIKKKSSMLKKNSDYEFNILNYSSKVRDNYYHKHELNVLNTNLNENSFYKLEYENDENVNIDLNFINTSIKENPSKKNKTSSSFNLKNLDLNKKINLIFRKNRVLLRKFLKVKFKRQNTFDRYIKNLIKLKNIDFLFNFEFKLINLLTRSLFFFNYSDCIWFLSNGYISVNGFVEYNKKRLIKPFEIINVACDSYYFFYYRHMIDNCLSNLYKFNLKIWKINTVRNLKTEKKKKQIEERYPNWIYKYIYYKNDIPKFIEVDYISMSMTLLNYNFNKNYLDYYNLKFLNLYQNRLYNWKTII